MLTAATALVALATAIFSDIQGARIDRHISGVVHTIDRVNGRVVLKVLAHGSGLRFDPGTGVSYQAQFRYLPVLLPPEIDLPQFVGEGFPMGVIGRQGTDGVLYAVAMYPAGGQEGFSEAGRIAVESMSENLGPAEYPGTGELELDPEVDPVREMERRER